ncbi:MAG: alpha/beta hydrolase [Bryobacterales bacterium]|nr:alpha/beta hydrolase [Bryobacterales bacterium]
MRTPRMLVVFAFAAAAAVLTAPAQTAPPRDPVPQPLYAGPAPGAVGSEEKDIPEITIYPAPQGASTRSAVVVFPGGGYVNLAMGHEGKDIANWLNARGVTAFVLKYRLAPRYRHPAMLQDAQRAIRTARSKAAALGFEKNRVGIWGFSAGGHLASTASTHFDAGSPSASDPIERESSRPDFAVLCYPVVSFDDAIAHSGSKRNLLGPNPESSLVENLSNEKQVTAQTPPTFLFHTGDDPGVPVENSIHYYLALRKHKVPAELHVYEHGRHGVGLAPFDPILSTWPARLEGWLRFHGWLSKP